MSDLRNLYSFLPENLTAAEIKYIENFRYNETHKHEIFPVSPGIIALFVVLYGSISLIAVVGNLLVIVVVIYKKNMQTVTNVFIANLALADVAIGLFTIPFQFHAALLQRWVVADFMCKVAPFVKNLSVNISIFTLSVIAFDRYVAVMYPLRAGFRRQVAITVLISIWVLSIVSSLPDALYYHIHVVIDPKSWTNIELCGVKWPSQSFATVYFSYLFLTQYIVPLSVISFSYIRVAFRIWGSKPPGNEIQRRDLIRSIHKKKVVKMLIIVVSLFALCWLPLQAYNFLASLYPAINRFKYINIIWFCCNWLAMSNSCYNPFIYGLLNEKFKREFKNLSSCCACFRRKGKYSQYLIYENSEEFNHKTSIVFHGLDSSHGSRPSKRRKRSVSFFKSHIQSTRINSGLHLPNVLETGKLEQTNPKWAYIEVPRPPVVLGYWPEIKEPVGHSKL